MKVYIFISSYHHSDDIAIHTIEGVYDNLKKAQKSLCESIYRDIQNKEYNRVELDGVKEIDEYNIFEMQNMFWDDPNFKFDVTKACLKDKDDDNFVEDYVEYFIEEKEVF